MCRNGYVFLDRCNQNTPTALTQAIGIIKVTAKPATGTPILHVEASFNSAERGLRRGILS